MRKSSLLRSGYGSPQRTVGLIRAEATTYHGPHRVARSILKERSCPSVVEVVQPQGSLQSLLEEIGVRTEANVATMLLGRKQPRVHAGTDESIIKPAGLQYWLEDACLVSTGSLRAVRSN